MPRWRRPPPRNARIPTCAIEQAGDASSIKALNKSFSDDFAKARTLSLPITLLILVVAFGALVAAGIPVLLAATGVAATLGLVGLVSQIAAVDQVVSETVLLIGMAVGVDYSLFYMRREREERAAGQDEQAALRAAAATSGRSVLISGLTVMAAMAGMYLAGNKTFASMATGTIIVVAVAVLGSLTVLPALLATLGDRVMKARVPFIARRREAGGEPRMWSAVVDRVLRRPLVSVLLSGGLVVALAIPAFGLHTSLPGLQGLPNGLGIVKTLNRIEKAFPGGPLPAYVVIQSKDVNTPQIRRRDRQPRAPGAGDGPDPSAVQGCGQRRTRRCRGIDAAQRQGYGRGLLPRARHAAPASDPGDGRVDGWQSRPRSPARPPSQRTSTIR